MKGFNGALMRYLGANEHAATVIDTQMISPNMRRLRMKSPTAFSDIRITPGSYLRCWFPDDKGKENQRAYTLLNMDPEAGEFDLDFLLHDPAGPASTWARGAEVGDELAVTPFGVRHFEVPSPPPPGYLLAADAAGIPLCNSLIEAIGEDIAIELYLGVHCEDDLLIPIASHPRLTIHHVAMRELTALAESIEVRDWTGWQAYLVPEAGALKHLRRRLTDEFGFPRSHLTAQAYWKAGKNMGITRDLPEIEDRPQAEKAGEVGTAASVSHSGDSAGATSDSARTAEASWSTNRGRELLRPVRGAMIASGIAQAIITCLELAPYLVLAEAGRRILAGAEATELLPLAYWFAGIMGAGVLLGSLLTIVMHLVDARFAANLRIRMLEHLSRLPLGWWAARGRAGVRRVLTDDVSSVHYLVTHAVLDAVGAILAPLIVLVYLFIVDWRLALACLLPVLVHLFLMYTMVFRSFDAVTEAPRRAEELRGHAVAYVEAQPVIAIFPGAGKVYDRQLTDYLDFLKNWQIPFSSLKTAMTLVSQPATFVLVIALAGTPLVLTGRIGVDTLLPFLFLGTTFASKLLAIGYQLQHLRGGTTAANDIAAVLAEPELAVPETPAAPPSSGRVTGRDVRFGYEPGREVVRGVSFDIPDGTSCALVGPSGAGKSTLAALIARFFDTGGQITIGGANIAELDPDELYRHVGFVFQDVEIARGTVAENIALARPEASREEIIEAARKARIHDRIEALPQGYDTPIGGHGFLSGGELQRIAIARLFLADPQVLVLDEATAYADPASAAHVTAALAELAGGHTVITIAHRLSSIAASDQILVIDGGQIVERGTHEELLAAGGTYVNLWETGCFAR